jgi:deoxyhypusine monooxygenase
MNFLRFGPFFKLMLAIWKTREQRTMTSSTVSEAVVSKLEEELLSDKADVTRKYRALFALRNVASASAVRALERCLLQAEVDDSQSARESSALLKHEVAYALGQVGLVSSIPTLARVLGDAKAHPMVRHEVSQYTRRTAVRCR